MTIMNLKKPIVLLAALLYGASASATAIQHDSFLWAKIAPNGQVLVSMESRSIYGSDDLGKHWSRLSEHGPLTEHFVLGPSRIGNELYLFEHERLLRSTDFGKHFKLFATVPVLDDVDPHPRNIDVLDDGRNIVKDGRGRLLLCSENRKRVVWYDPRFRTWGHGDTLEADGAKVCGGVLVSNQVYYAYGFDVVDSSISAGWTWTSVPIPKPLIPPGEYLMPTLFANDTGTLYSQIATPNGMRIASSRDQGRHWTTRIFPGLVDRPDEDQLLVGLQGADLYIAVGPKGQGRFRAISALYRADAGAGNGPARRLLQPRAETFMNLNVFDTTANGYVALAIEQLDGSKLLISKDRGDTWSCHAWEEVAGPTCVYGW